MDKDKITLTVNLTARPSIDKQVLNLYQIVRFADPDERAGYGPAFDYFQLPTSVLDIVARDEHGQTVWSISRCNNCNNAIYDNDGWLHEPTGRTVCSSCVAKGVPVGKQQA